MSLHEPHFDSARLLRTAALTVRGLLIALTLAFLVTEAARAAPPPDAAVPASPPPSIL